MNNALLSAHFGFADNLEITHSCCTDYFRVKAWLRIRAYSEIPTSAIQGDKTTSTESKQMSLERPVAVCTRCGAVSYNAMLIDGVCGRSRGDGKHCRGVNGSALNQTDWAACDKCAVTGLVGSARCERCDGVGWLFLRR